MGTKLRLRWAGSSAIFAARSKVRPRSRMPSPSRSAGPRRSARSSSASAARSFIPSTLRRSSAIGKGQGSRAYEFGVKASPGALFVLHARALPDNAYDGHTLRTSSTAPRHSPAVRSSGPMSTRDTVATTRKIVVASSSPARSAASSVSSSASCAAARPLIIGHLKTDGHLGRCYLKGRLGDAANVILSPSATTSVASSPGRGLFGA